MSVRVLAPGVQSTVQDGGRHGARHLGVGVAGALDPFSFAVANLLVGNVAGAAVVETVLAGPTLAFDRPARIALCGASCDARVGAAAIPGWRPVDLPAGSELRLGRCRDGARAYLAVAGGWSVPRVMGSASTDLRGGFGGVGGRSLVGGDRLDIASQAVPDAAGGDELRVARWWIDPAPDVDLAAPAIIRVLPGHDATTPADALFATSWRVGVSSNRQGLRLAGAPLQLEAGAGDPRRRPSEPVMPGTLQLPADGQPIVLLADAQTHGGYPRIGHAIACDLPRLAQLRPGDDIRFTACSQAQALQLRRERAARLARIAMAIEARNHGATR